MIINIQTFLDKLSAHTSLDLHCKVDFNGRKQANTWASRSISLYLTFSQSPSGQKMRNNNFNSFNNNNKKKASRSQACTHPPRSGCHWVGKHNRELLLLLYVSWLTNWPPCWSCRFDAFSVAMRVPVFAKRARGLRHVHADSRWLLPAFAFSPFSLSLCSPAAQLPHTPRLFQPLPSLPSGGVQGAQWK